MQTFSDPHQFPAALKGTVLCIGNFDGVHLGHAKMLSTGRDEARRRGKPFTIMTFDPHPSLLLKPNMARLPLLTREQRLDILGSFGPDALIVIPTTREFLGIAAEDFLQTIVIDRLGTSLLVEGPTFTYGRGARGTVETLRQSKAFQTIMVPTVQQSLCDLSLINVSSTLIRWLVSHGRVADAHRALGRPYTLRGTVVEGKKRGRTIGFPTANLETQQLYPAPGIYAGTARTASGPTFRAAISVGNNPTFNNPTTTVEAYLLDFPSPNASPDLYNQTLEIAFHAWLRDMLTYSQLPALIDQISRDVAQTRAFIKESA